MSDDHTLVVLCTCPDTDTARRLAEAAVRGRHAACANIVPGVTSVYEWDGAVQADSEVLMVLKTSATAYAGLEEAVRRLHPYELPEIIAVSVDRGLEGYLQWVTTECRRAGA